MASKVYYTDMHTADGNSLMDKLNTLIRKAGICDIDMDKKFVAIKLHVGEFGNLSYPRPQFVHVISDLVKEKGGIPYMVDCNTLYVGMRKNAVEHMQCAELNGFNSVTAGCPFIVGDGINGTDDVEIPVNGEYVKAAKIGRGVADADIIITLSHYKGHEQTGIGGAIKTLGMGCASRRGKLEIHSATRPYVNKDRCVGCGSCMKVCAHGALTLKDGKMNADSSKCAGCGRCIAHCKYDAMLPNYDEHMDVLNCKLVEYAKAVIDGKPNFHISLLMDVSPVCDCHGHNDLPIIPNVGLFASFDPVALDLACTEMAQKQPMIPGSVLFNACNGQKPEDIFAATNKNTHWQSHFTHSVKMGMGDGSYELIKI